MAVDKDFVIRNGIEVNENLIYADAETDKVGIGTTTPDKKLVVIGDAEVSTSLVVGTAITAQRADFTGIITSHAGIDIGVGGTVLRTSVDTKNVGINSTIPRYTLDVIGPVSIGQTAEYVYGDLTVTGDIKASSLSGQISAGGTVGFTNVTVEKNLFANNAGLYTLFRVEEFNSNKFRFTTSGDPVSIGFTQNTNNPEIYLARGQHYKFDVDAGGFPFYIKTQPTADLNNIYDNGVDGNGAQVGFVTFKVPFNAPNILYYQASNVSGMGGTIYIGNDNKTLTVGVLTVTDYMDVNQGDFDNIYVSGIGTLNNIKSPNFSVSSGIVTALQFVGVSTGSDRVSINQKSDNTNYKVTFTEHTGIASNFQYTYIDSESSQLTYNPSTNILSCARFVGNVSGIATGADNINVDQKNDDTSYQVIFSDTDGSAYQRMYIDTDNTHLTYNPSTQTFSVQNISSTNVNATTFTGDLSGTATNANFINVDEKNDNVNYQIVFNDNQGASYQRLYIDDNSGQFVYNPSTRTFSVQNISSTNVTGTTFTGTDFIGQASNATNLNLQARNTTNATHYITFGTSTTGNQRLNTDTSLTYNPSTNTLSVANFSGTATNADYINVDERSDSTAYQVLFSDNQGAGYQRPYIDGGSGQFTYNPSSNTLSVGSFSGNGASITNINGSNISSGTVSADRLPDASTSAQGVVQLNNTYPPTSTSTTTTITVNVARQLYNTAQSQIPSGSVMLFYQASAPAGWTKITTQNNKTLRVVSGSGGSTGGNLSFTDVFTTRSVPVPRHQHSGTTDNQSNNHTHGVSGSTGNNDSNHSHTGSTTTDGAHTHSINDPGHFHSYDRNEGDTEGGGGDEGGNNKQRDTNTRKTGISILSTNSGHSHNIATGNQNQNHKHSINLTTDGISANHNHTFTTSYEGTSGASMDFRVQYIDVILAQKN